MTSVWSSHPKQADKKLVASLAKNGPIAQCLDEALKQIMKNDEHPPASAQSENISEPIDHQDQEHKNQRDDSGREQMIIMWNDDLAGKIMESFGAAVASTKWNSTSMVSPPAALLRGKIRHFNRMGGQWRIVCANAEIRQRPHLDKNRRNRKRQSLWNCSGTAAGSEGLDTIKIDDDLQILAYDDFI